MWIQRGCSECFTFHFKMFSGSIKTCVHVSMLAFVYMCAWKHFSVSAGYSVCVSVVPGLWVCGCILVCKCLLVSCVFLYVSMWLYMCIRRHNILYEYGCLLFSCAFNWLIWLLYISFFYWIWNNELLLCNCTTTAFLVYYYYSVYLYLILSYFKHLILLYFN